MKAFDVADHIRISFRNGDLFQVSKLMTYKCCEFKNTSLQQSQREIKMTVSQLRHCK